MTNEETNSGRLSLRPSVSHDWTNVVLPNVGNISTKEKEKELPSLYFGFTTCRLVC